MAGLKAGGLTPEQESAITALLNEPTVAKAAATAGVGERTLYRWMGEPEFASAYRAARREAFSHAVSLTQRYAPVAVQALAKVVTDPASPPSTRVAAAVALLKFSRESLELDDLAARLEALEAAAKGAA